MFSNRQLITPFKPKANPIINDLGHCFLVGSCFADRMAGFLQQSGFSVASNPFGTLYHPLSIAQMFRRVKEDCDYRAEDFVLNNELWHTWEQHSSLSDTDPQNLHLEIRSRIEAMRNCLSGKSYVFITLGTAWVYALKENGMEVANCHRHPGTLFSKRLLGIDEIKASLKYIYGIIKHFNPESELILSISPVRYSRDGLVENNRSKARLLEAVHGVIDEQSDIVYYPAYEFIIDHLRDYRFYDLDMLHPSPQATTLLFDALVELCMADPIKDAVHEIMEFRKMEGHRPLFADTKAYQNFLIQREQRKSELFGKYPNITL